MSKEQIKRQFAYLRDSINKVLLSCKTDDQLIAAYSWGINVVWNYFNLIKRTEKRKNVLYAGLYRHYVLNNLFCCFYNNVLARIQEQATK